MKEYFSAVGDCNLYWIEEPFRENEKDFAELREHLDKVYPNALIVDGETDPDMDLLIHLYKEGLLGVFQMDIQGGYTLGHAFGLSKWRRCKIFIPEKPGWGMDFWWGSPITGDGEQKTCARQV